MGLVVTLMREDGGVEKGGGKEGKGPRNICDAKSIGPNDQLGREELKERVLMDIGTTD